MAPSVVRGEASTGVRAEQYAAVKKLRTWFGDEDALVRSWTEAAEKHLHDLTHQIIMAEAKGRLQRLE